MSLEKVVDADQVNDSTINSQDSQSFVDKASGTAKRKRLNPAGQIITENVLGDMKPTTSGTIVLVAGQITVNLQIPISEQEVKRVFIQRKAAGGAPGFLSVEITIPGGPGLPSEFTINSSSNTDTSTIDYTVFSAQN